MSNKPAVLITGSNKGIGLQIAKDLGRKNWKVCISGRNAEKLEHALGELRKEGLDVEMLVMDVSSLESIRAAAIEFRKKNILLDVLINNAGILLREDINLLTNPPELIHTTIQTNAYGALYVTREFLPYLKRPGRIINMSSEGGSMTDEVGGWSPAYCVSKTLLNSITRQLAYEMKSENIAVNAVCPGWTKTDMGGRNAPRDITKGAETPAWLASEASAKYTGMFFRDKKEIPW
jgi:NAD(P)-dependent dehydrogenase (short-subunit alcohol dehydrogenase family)